MGAHIALRPGPPIGFLGWVLPQWTRPMGAIVRSKYDSIIIFQKSRYYIKQGVCAGQFKQDVFVVILSRAFL
jgi:hypothetical protein